ncbi:MAG: hypothetical protein Q9218_001340 [Villophora microphyllina]
MSSILRLLGSGNGREMDRASTQLGGSSSRGRPQSSSASNEVRGRSVGPSVGSKENKASGREDYDDLKSKLHQKERELLRLRQENEAFIETNHALIAENHHLTAWASQARQDLESGRQRNYYLEQELQACKDDLFKIQSRVKIPDSEITQAYDDLQEHISSWMEGEISYFEASYQEHDGGPLPNLFDHAGWPAAKRLLSAHPTSGGEYLVRYVLQKMLQKLVFANDILLLGLEAPETAFIRKIEQSMSAATPSRDPELISSWRSETLSALSEAPEIQQRYNKLYNRIVAEIFDQVAKVFPIMKKTQESLERLYNRVVDPALKLARTIQTSPTDYEFAPKAHLFSIPDPQVVSRDRLSKAKLIDIVTGKTLKTDSPVQSDGRGQIGTLVMVLAPALYRKDAEQNSLLLVKEVNVVQLFQPLGRRRDSSY